jgi:energy-coupling factor transporter ATP-binding protein EcfA2
MITKVVVRSFKSLENVEIELGNLNVFVGANGSGKSNLLEAIGVLSAAADGKVNDQTLLQRGVRPGVPKLYKTAFPGKQPSFISFTGHSADSHYDVSLNNPLNDPTPAWRFKHELLEQGQTRLASRGPNSRDNPNKENGLAALKAVELKENDSALALMRRLQGFVIYSPTTPVLRGIAIETQPRQPLGLSGGRLPEAIRELQKGLSRGAEIDWLGIQLRTIACFGVAVVPFGQRDSDGDTLLGSIHEKRSKYSFGIRCK